MAHLQNDQIIMEVRDDGEDLRKFQSKTILRLGLKNTRARLRNFMAKIIVSLLERERWTIAKCNPLCLLRTNERRVALNRKSASYCRR